LYSSISPTERFGLKVLGYNIVNVAQKLDVNISQQGNVSVSAATDLFHSPTLSLNESTIMQYNQPSYTATHSLPVIGTTTSDPSAGPGQMPIYNNSYKPAIWYKRL